MPQAIIGKWGKSLAIRFPGDVAESAGLGDGQQVEISAAGETIIIRKVTSNPSVEAMFSGGSPEVWRELYDDAYDWGPDRGRERLEE